MDLIFAKEISAVTPIREASTIELIRSLALLKFKPEISIEDGVRDTIKWYLQNKQLADTGKDVFKSLKGALK